MLFGFAFSGGGGHGQAAHRVADLDASEGSRQFVAALRAMPELEVDVQGENAATELVRTGKRTAAVLVPKGYGAERAATVLWRAARRVEVVIDPAARPSRP